MVLLLYFIFIVFYFDWLVSITRPPKWYFGCYSPWILFHWVYDRLRKNSLALIYLCTTSIVFLRTEREKGDEARLVDGLPTTMRTRQRSGSISSRRWTRRRPRLDRLWTETLGPRAPAGSEELRRRRRCSELLRAQARGSGFLARRWSKGGVRFGRWWTRESAATTLARIGHGDAASGWKKKARARVGVREWDESKRRREWLGARWNGAGASAGLPTRADKERRGAGRSDHVSCSRWSAHTLDCPALRTDHPVNYSRRSLLFARATRSAGQSPDCPVLPRADRMLLFHANISLLFLARLHIVPNT
jgi:hypothetical protein